MMNEIIKLQNEIEFLYKENKMLSQKVNELGKQNERLELKIADLMAAYLELKIKNEQIY